MIVTFVLAALILSGGSIVRTRFWLPAVSRRAAVERAPETEALLVLGLLLLDDGQLNEAEELLTRVRDQDPGSVSAVNGLAVIHYERARIDPDGGHAFHQRGLALLREAEALDPEDLSVLYNYGKFYQAMDMHYPAVRVLRRYIDKDQASQWAEEAAYDLAKLTAP